MDFFTDWHPKDWFHVKSERWNNSQTSTLCLDFLSNHPWIDELKTSLWRRVCWAKTVNFVPIQFALNSRPLSSPPPPGWCLKQCQCLGIRSNGLLISDTFQIEHQLHDFYLNHIDIFFILASIEQCRRFDYSIQVLFYILPNLLMSKVLRTLFCITIFKISEVWLFPNFALANELASRAYFELFSNLVPWILVDLESTKIFFTWSDVLLYDSATLTDVQRGWYLLIFVRNVLILTEKYKTWKKTRNWLQKW